MILHPTHHCFDDAAEFIADRVEDHPALAHGTNLRLVHAICRFPEDQPRAGELFAHAWCEERVTIQGKRRAIVWHAALALNERIYLCSPRAAYYRQLRVVKTTTYTIRQVWKENERTRSYGPWREEYLALTRGGGKGRTPDA